MKVYKSFFSPCLASRSVCETVCSTDSSLFIYHGRGLAEGHVMWLNVLKTSVKLVMRLWSEMYQLCHSRLMSVFERPIYSQIFLSVRCVTFLLF